MSGIQRPLQILYQDAKYFCISKPAKCAIQGKPYQEQGQNWQQLVKEATIASNAVQPIHVAHRLDANTTGALMFARGPQTAAQLSKLVQLNKVKKSYLAIVDAKNMLPEHKVIKDRGSGETVEKMMTKTATGPRLATEEESAEAAEREALEEEAGKKHSDRSQKKLPKNTTKSVTTWKTLSCNDRYAFLQLNPTTGRKHQLRLICSHVLNAPIIGDFKYGYEGEQVSGHLLHCFQLKFPNHLKSGKRVWVDIQAPIPDSFYEFAEKHGLPLPSLEELTRSADEANA